MVSCPPVTREAFYTRETPKPCHIPRTYTKGLKNLQRLQSHRSLLKSDLQSDRNLETFKDL